MRRVIIVLALAGLPGGVYADDPAAPDSVAAAPAPAVAAPAPAPDAAVPIGGAVPATNASPAVTAAPAAAAEAHTPAHEATVLTMATPPPDPEFKVPSGYKPRTQGLETVYCKTYHPMCSRVPRTDCYTKAQVKAIEQASAAASREVQQKAAGCVGNSGGS